MEFSLVSRGSINNRILLQIFLHVSIFNKSAQQLYKKFGFKPVQYLDNYYRDENEDAILMCLDLTL